MTSAYDRASERTSVQTRGEGEGRLEIFLTGTHTGNQGLPSFFGGFLFRKVRKTHISICHVNKRSETLIQRFKVGSSEAERERERQRARINRQRCGKEVRERAGHG